MSRRSVLLVVGCFAWLGADIVQAQAACSVAVGPLAAKEAVALGIFNVVADGLESRTRRAKYETKIHDMGTSWSVYEVVREEGAGALM